ncbi:MAG: EAL domain-containing protein [Arcobacteraceae bacterium]|nr:EAL domain-containing protein [Arcobacteraceae bacterium]
MNNDVSRLKDITVLYCEDEQYLRDVTKGILETFTKKQYVAEDGAIGLELFKKYEDDIDLIITDVNMPNMNGLDMTKEIKAINPNIPIVVATAFSNSEYLLEAIELGVDKYVLKPINIKKLLDTMNQSLMYHELRDLYKDQLTHLPNRNALIKDVKNSDSTLLALIDIDKFSVLNDLYGEEFGDKILLSFTEQIKNTFQKFYKIYRVGSDRFVVLCSCDDDISCQSDFKELANQFSNIIDKDGINVDDTNIDINITIGVAQSKDKHAFEYAQRAMQKARKKYLQILEYDESLFEQKKDIQENITWIKKIKSGIADNSFHSFLQPIVDAQTQEIYKYEALIRYIGEDGKEVAPFCFLPIAKKAKLFPIIIKVMLTNVISIIQEKNIRVAINLSFDDIINKETHNFIFTTLEEHPQEAKLIEFEILESEEIEDFDIVREFIAKIRKFGCKIGVDDFGAGYSNFNMLEALNIDYVKIDGSLIKEIDHLPKQALIVETIAQFCKKLGIKTVAEFVSSEEIYHTAKKLGIDYMQGYHFGKPVNKDTI